VVRPFHLSWTQSGVEPSRTVRTVRRVLGLTETQVEAELEHVYRDFARRHWQTRKIFEERWEALAGELSHYGMMGDLDPPPAMRELIGAYFSHEYAYAAAALMNPSVVPHPDQTGLEEGAVRFAMSLRAVGEGHISTICFREGIVTPDRQMTLQPDPPFATSADMIRDLDGDGRTGPDDPVCVYRHRDSSLSATVLFPVTEAQSKGLEDLRLTRFEDGEWLGTYTAFNGSDIRSELLRTRDFRSFILQPMFGSAARNKGMALFPERIDGRYMMLGRQDGENLFLLASDRLDEWGEGAKLMEPRYPWEFIQIGNCGSPIRIDEGWLVLTHGVGAVRRYTIGAVLLDGNDPSKILGRTEYPVLAASGEERDGYVPNVVYSCGGMVVGRDLFLPYGIADSSVGFAFIGLDELMAAMV